MLGWFPMHLARLRWLAAYPDIVQLRSLREAVAAARDRGDRSETAKLDRGFVTADPTAFDITVQPRHAWKEMGDPDQEAQAYHSALETNPLGDDLRLQISRVEKMRRDFADAAAHRQRGAQINPVNAEAQRESAALGRVRERSGEAGTIASGGAGGGGSARHDVGKLTFLDARAGEIYQQLLAIMA